MKKRKDIKYDEMLTEYDFSNAVQGKYAKKYVAGHNVVLLDEDVAPFFKNSELVNQVLRTLIGLAQKKIRKPTGSLRS